MSTTTPYPKRPAFFVCKFLRLLVKKTVANDIGPQAFVLLTVVATTEDARGYTDPVSFYNGQLLPLVGVGCVDSLDRIRRKAIEAGWLVYIPGGRRSGPGRYWVTIPERYAGTDDAPTDEPSTDYTLFRTGAEQSRSKQRSKAGANGGTFLPVPVPSLSAVEATAAASPTTDKTTKTKKARKQTPPAEKKPHPRNPLFDAIADVTGADPKLNGPRIGKIAAALSQAYPPYTPDDVAEFGRRFLELCSFAKGERTRPELGDVQNHISKLRAARQTTGPPAATDQRERDRRELLNMVKLGNMTRAEAEKLFGGPLDVNAAA